MSLLEDNFRDSFLRGFSSVLNMHPRIELSKRIATELFEDGLRLDANVLKEDSKKLEQDFRKALVKYEKCRN